MIDNNFIIIDGFIKERKNKVIENYQIIVSDSSIYLFNSSQNYGKYLKSIFSGVTEILGLFGAFGLVGELASEITGDKLSKMLKEYSKKSSKNNTKKLIKNLESISADKKGITRIDYCNLTKVTIKRGFIINGSSSVEFSEKSNNLKLKTKDRNKINELTNAIGAFDNSINIKTKFL